MSVAPTPQLGKGGGLLDAAPLRAAILRDAAVAGADPPDSLGGLTLIAGRARMGERVLYRVVHESTTVTLDLADAYCCSTGRHLADLYPHLYTPEQADADVLMREAIDACAHLSHGGYQTAAIRRTFASLVASAQAVA